MGYPNLPDNRVIVNGVDLSERYGMILSDGYTLTPPSPKTFTVDIPGGNGILDLTESLMGDVSYSNRKQTFTFYLINVKDFEMAKTEIKNFLHGKKYSYQLTFDKGYTYTGRFKVTETSHATYADGIVGTIKIEVDAEPFKYQPNQVYAIDAIGGKTVFFKSGRKRVKPKIETDGYLKVIFKGKEYILQEGTWVLNDLIFTEGINEVYFKTLDVKNLTWNELVSKQTTWGTLLGKKAHEWYQSSGDGNLTYKTWDMLGDKTWEDMQNSKWSDLAYQDNYADTVRRVYIEYEVGDI